MPGGRCAPAPRRAWASPHWFDRPRDVVKILRILPAIVLVAACSSTSNAADGGPLAGGGEGAGVSHPSEAGASYVYGGILLCTTGDPAVIDKVEAAQVE